MQIHQNFSLKKYNTFGIEAKAKQFVAVHNLEELKYIDESLYQVARFGKFGANGIKVLPNFTVATNAKEFKAVVHRIPSKFHFFGFDVSSMRNVPSHEGQ